MPQSEGTAVAMSNRFFISTYETTRSHGSRRGATIRFTRLFPNGTPPGVGGPFKITVEGDLELEDFPLGGEFEIAIVAVVANKP